MRKIHSSLSTALDAFGVCFETIRQKFYGATDGQFKAFAIELINWFDYNYIESFAIKKKLEVIKFDDLRFLSIMPTPWRMIEDVICDNLGETITGIVNK